MALKTGASHSLATLFLTLISAMLVHLLQNEGFFEKVFVFLAHFSLKFSQWIEQSMGIIIAHELFPTLFIATVLAFIWGVVFHYIRK